MILSPVDNKKRRILIVDDDETSRHLVGKALEYEGYQVAQAENGNAGLDKIAEWKPHLILLDVNMPGLNGLETLAKLRVMDEYVSVIFVSGNRKTEDIMRGLD